MSRGLSDVIRYRLPGLATTMLSVVRALEVDWDGVGERSSRKSSFGLLALGPSATTLASAFTSEADVQETATVQVPQSLTCNDRICHASYLGTETTHNPTRWPKTPPQEAQIPPAQIARAVCHTMRDYDATCATH